VASLKPSSATGAAEAISDSEPKILVRKGGLFILWKPPGWAVSVSADEKGIEMLSRHPGGCELELQDWLQSKFADCSPTVTDPLVAYGLLHRLDRNTSGAILWASNYSNYFAARLQFAARRVWKQYICLCYGPVSLTRKFLEEPLQETVGSNGLLRSVVAPQGRAACTEVLSVAHLRSSDNQVLSLVQVRLHTGRLHQIRAHMSHAGHPLVGDPHYGVRTHSNPLCSRIFLHAQYVAIEVLDEPLHVELDLPPDLLYALSCLTPVSHLSQALFNKWFS